MTGETVQPEVRNENCNMNIFFANRSNCNDEMTRQKFFVTAFRWEFYFVTSARNIMCIKIHYMP